MTDVGKKIKDLTAKTTVVDTDEFVINDVANSNVDKKITRANLLGSADIQMNDNAIEDVDYVGFNSGPFLRVAGSGRLGITLTKDGDGDRDLQTRKIFVTKSSGTGMDFTGSGGNMIFTGGGSIQLQPLSKLFLDGGGDTSISETSADVLTFEVGDVDAIALGTTVLTFLDAIDIAVGTTTGTKIGTGTTQKIGFWNVTPVAQPSHIADATDAASVITQLNLLLADMATLGLQAAS